MLLPALPPDGDAFTHARRRIASTLACGWLKQTMYHQRNGSFLEFHSSEMRDSDTRASPNHHTQTQTIFTWEPALDRSCISNRLPNIQWKTIVVFQTFIGRDWPATAGKNQPYKSSPHAVRNSSHRKFTWVAHILFEILPFKMLLKIAYTWISHVSHPTPTQNDLT